MTHADVLEREARLRDAMLTNDVAALDALLDDELVFVGPGGDLINKAQDLAAHRARRLQLTELTFGERHVRSHGDACVVIVCATLAGSWDGTPMEGTFRDTRVWTQRQGDWRVLAGHVSAMGPAPTE